MSRKAWLTAIPLMIVGLLIWAGVIALVVTLL